MKITTEKNELIEYFKKALEDMKWDCEDEGDMEIINDLIAQMVEELPLLCNYEEEDEQIDFKIAFRIKSFDEDDVECSDFGRFIYVGKEEMQEVQEAKGKIHLIIKRIAPLCTHSMNLFIRINAGSLFEYPEIAYGIYEMPIEMSGVDDKNMIQDGYTIIQPHNDNILLRNSKEVMVLKRNWYPEIDENIFEPKKATICRIWNGIFRRIKSEVHGTIILFVNDEWDESDEEFDKIKLINSDIYIDGGKEKSVNDWRVFSQNVDVLISMLNHDGITIINTSGRIMAYNVFVKEDMTNEQIYGGARTRAYQKLKSINHDGLVGVYYQSQEGEIKYYAFEEETELDRFNEEIMNENTDNRFLQEAKKVISEFSIVSSDDELSFEINNLVDSLYSIHNGIDNFYREKDASKELRDKVCNINDLSSEIMDDMLYRKLINTVIACYVGNMYGYSWSGVSYCKEIIKKIPMQVKERYIKQKWYYDDNLVDDLRYTQPQRRFNQLLDECFPKNKEVDELKNYTTKDFQELSTAINDVLYF